MATFCATNGQTVNNNPSIRFSYTDGCIAAGQVITTEFLTAAKNQLWAIYNYGAKGTRNPTKAVLDALPAIPSDGAIITAEIYNSLIDVVGGTRISQGDTLLGTYNQALIDAINSYQINSDRCDSCNSGCQEACQISAQGCTGCYWCLVDQYAGSGTAGL